MNITVFSFTKNGKDINIRLMDILKNNNVSSYTMSKYISDSFQEDDNGKKGMFVPDVIAVKNGKMLAYHVSLVDDYDIHKNDQLSESQKQELYNIYQQMVNQIK